MATTKSTSTNNFLLLLLLMVCLVTIVDLAKLSEDEKIATQVKVTSPPRIVQEPAKEVAYKKDEQVVLNCVANGDPHPQYSWTKDGIPLNIDELDIKKMPAQGTLLIEQAQVRHEGVYQCFASNTYGKALSVKSLLKKAELASFQTIAEPLKHTPNIGEYLKLECDPPYSYPTGITYWGEDIPGAKFKAIDTDKRIALDYNGSLHFANIETGDALNANSYVCIVQNLVLRGLVQGDDQQIKPRRTQETITRIKPILKWSSESPTVATVGSTKKMMCIFAGYPTPDVTWSMANGDSLPNKVLIGSHGREIIIKDVDYSDDNKYKCTASNHPADNPASNPSKVLQLRVESVPTWLTQPESMDTSDEEDAEFHCVAGGIPKPNIEWYINGIPIDEDQNPRRQVLNNGELIKYTRVTEQDAAVLQCNATNAHGYIFLNAYLNVIAEPPVFISKPAASIKVAVGQNTNLTCEVYGAPKPTVLWKQENETKEGPRFTVNTKGKIVGNLTIQHITMEDAGVYTCTAENKFGKITAVGELIVRERTEIFTFPESKTVHATENIVLDCQAKTDSAEEKKLKISWLKNGEKIEFGSPGTSKSLSLNTKNNSLIITASSVTDTASYTCVADNGLDRDEYSAEIVVKDKPDPPTDLYLLGCGAQTAEVTWTAGKDNHDEIQNFYIYYNTSFDEKGVFHLGATVAKSELRAKIRLSPWANYTFYATARNSLGESDKSIFTWSTCITQASIPFKNPDGVCTESRGSNELVIVWTPMDRIDHNGEDFLYLVTYERQDNGGATPIQRKVTNWQDSELVISNQPTFHKYKISVEAENSQGKAPTSKLVQRYGYSGEDAPTISPTGFGIDNSSLNATSVQFTWNQVDENDPAINGFFRGYKIVYWREDQPQEKRSTEIILNDFDPCPEIVESGRKKRQASSGVAITGDVVDLWPYSKTVAGIMVLNGGKEGVMSDTISFTTLEGLPGRVGMAKVTETGSYHIKLVWTPPLLPNGVLAGYTVGYKETGSLHKVTTEFVGMALSKKFTDLTPATDYMLYVFAHSGVGMGDQYVVEDKTVMAGPPDKPSVGDMMHGETSVNMTIVPTDNNNDPDSSNPGQEFYVKYRKQGEDEWQIAPVQGDNLWINITDLENGERHEIVVVAVNGKGDDRRETPSDPIVFIAGPKEGAVVPDEPVKEEIAEPVQQPIATAGWFIGMMCAIIFLLLVLLIICLIRRNRGGKYPVHEKEKLRGRNPDDEEENFGEYNNKQPYMPLETKGDEPPFKPKPALPPANMDDDEKPLDAGSSESDSMAEYEDTDPTKFNEDGSFIGQYGDYDGKRDSIIQPDNQQNALSTFV